MAEESNRTSRPILVAIDFSIFSERALVWAARAAKKFDAPLVALHVMHDPESAPGYYQRSKKGSEHLERLELAAADMMSEFLDRMQEEHSELTGELTRRLELGLPITRILEVAEDIGAQMIVMGSQGRTGLPHLLLGSKAEKVVQLSPIPVTIVKGSKT